MFIIYVILGSLIIIGVAIVAFQLYIKYLMQKEFNLAKTSGHLQSDPLLEAVDPNRIALIYFTAEWCSPCKTMQTPAVQALQDEMPDLHVITIDVDEEPEIGKRWQVMGLPRTFIIGKNHQICATNIDFVDKATLKTQLNNARDNKEKEVQVNQYIEQNFFLPKFIDKKS